MLLQDESMQRQQHRNYFSVFFQQPSIEIVPSPMPFFYRNRVSLRPDNDGILGYYKNKSHTHVTIDHCSIAHPRINDVLHSLSPLPFPAKQVEFRTDGTRVLANVRSQKGRRPTKQRLRKWAEPILDGIGLDGTKMWGEQYCHFTVAEVEHSLSLGTFFQVNPAVNAAMVQRICNVVESHAPTKVLDLYSGAGNIAFALAHRGIPVVMIERAGSSIQDAKNTAKRTDLPVEIRQADADRFQAGDSFFDVAVLDPPRKGAAGVLSELSLTRPKCIVYVSCNPYALQKDLKEAARVGYAVKKMTMFEMFPQTKHVEMVVELTPT